MKKPVAVACPKCQGMASIYVSYGGRGTGDLTSYYADCENCGKLVDHLSSTGRYDSAVRDYNRWASDYASDGAQGGNARQHQVTSKKVRAESAAISRDGAAGGWPNDQPGRYLVSGYCLVPVKAEIEVDAQSPEQAIWLAMEKMRQDPRSLIVPGTADEGAACEWQPTATRQLSQH